MNTLYTIGKVLGYGSMGILAGLCTIHLIEHSFGNPQGPIYTALTNRKAGAIVSVLAVLSVTGVYVILTDLLALLS